MCSVGGVYFPRYCVKFTSASHPLCVNFAQFVLARYGFQKSFTGRGVYYLKTIRSST